MKTFKLLVVHCQSLVIWSLCDNWKFGKWIVFTNNQDYGIKNICGDWKKWWLNKSTNDWNLWQQQKIWWLKLWPKKKLWSKRSIGNWKIWGDQNFGNGNFVATETLATNFFVVIESCDNQKWWRLKSPNCGNWKPFQSPQGVWWLKAISATTRYMATKMGPILITFILTLGSLRWAMT